MNRKHKSISDNSVKQNRRKISQSDIPSSSLEKSLRVARAIYDNYGKDPVKPLGVAKAMNVSPSSGPFRMITGAAVAYGLTEGGYNSGTIALTNLGRRILAPTIEGDDLKAKQEAILKPRIISEFLDKYNDSPLPSDGIAYNVLEEMGVPRDRSKQVLELILESAKQVGFLTEIKGRTYVDLQGNNADLIVEGKVDDDSIEFEQPEVISSAQKTEVVVPRSTEQNLIKKVFITHGKNQSLLEPIKKLLLFGGFEPIIATEKQTVSQPVPEKVMGSMRVCGAAIIHIEAEDKIIDQNAEEHIILNPNVLIEIGAAMALYGKRFILLVKDGIQLPSNLQGLYEVRYSGETLDSNVTIKLLEAINDIKNHPLPGY